MPIQGYAAVCQLDLSLEFDQGPHLEVTNSWQEIFPLLDGSLKFFTLCFGLFLHDSLMCSWSNFGRPATSDRVHHWSQFSPHVDNGSQHGLQVSYRLRNGFATPWMSLNHRMMCCFLKYFSHLSFIREWFPQSTDLAVIRPKWWLWNWTQFSRNGNSSFNSWFNKNLKSFFHVRLGGFGWLFL